MRTSVATSTFARPLRNDSIASERARCKRNSRLIGHVMLRWVYMQLVPPSHNVSRSCGLVVMQRHLDILSTYVRLLVLRCRRLRMMRRCFVVLKGRCSTSEWHGTKFKRLQHVTLVVARMSECIAWGHALCADGC